MILAREDKKPLSDIRMNIDINDAEDSLRIAQEMIEAIDKVRKKLIESTI